MAWISRRQLAKAEADLAVRRGRSLPVGIEAPHGFYLEFESPDGFELKLESLESVRAGIELVAARKSTAKRSRLFSSPKGRSSFFVMRVEAYLAENSAKGRPKNQALVETSRKFASPSRKASGPTNLTPCPHRAHQAGGRSGFAATTRKSWPDFATRPMRWGSQLANGLLRSRSARWFLPKERSTSSPARSSSWTRSPNFDARTTSEASSRARRPRSRQPGPRTSAPARSHLPPRPSPSASSTPASIVGMCSLRTFSLRNDSHACKPQWGVDDHNGHGTEMAGIAAYGDLREVLASSGPIDLRHRLESVKDPSPAAGQEPQGPLWRSDRGGGRLRRDCRAGATSCNRAGCDDDGISRPRAADVMVVRGRQNFCAGADGGEQRLFFVSAGNLLENAGMDFRSRNETEGVHDPAQAWNALTVGACTERIAIDEASYSGWTCVAERGDLAPTSTTSCIWQGQWPVKPDIVMEGGNMALSPDRQGSRLSGFTAPCSRRTTGPTFASSARLATRAPRRRPPLASAPSFALSIRRWWPRQSARSSSTPPSGRHV